MLRFGRIELAISVVTSIALWALVGITTLGCGSGVGPMREQDPSNSRTALSGTVHFAAGKKFALNKDQLTHAAAIFEEMSDLAGRKPVKIDVDAAWTELLRIRFEEDDSDEHFAFYSALGVVEFGENKACSLSESELLTVVEFFESVSDAAPTED